jgi:hypothetical protein
MISKSAGRNGAGVRVGGRRRVGEGRGVAVEDGRGVGVGEPGVRLALGTEEGVALCKMGGVWAGSLAALHAKPRKMAPERTVLSRMWLFFIRFSL